MTHFFPKKTFLISYTWSSNERNCRIGTWKSSLVVMNWRTLGTVSFLEKVQDPLAYDITLCTWTLQLKIDLPASQGTSRDVKIGQTTWRSGDNVQNLAQAAAIPAYTEHLCEWRCIHQFLEAGYWQHFEPVDRPTRSEDSVAPARSPCCT